MHKFGGASLADSAAVRHAVEIIRRHRKEPTVVVVSAMAGTTDALLGVAQQAGAGEARTVASLDRPTAVAARRGGAGAAPGGRGRADLLAYIGDAFEELEALAQGLRLLRDLTPRTTDYVVSRGERAERPARRRRARGDAASRQSTWMPSRSSIPTARSGRPRPTTRAPTARRSAPSRRSSPGASSRSCRGSSAATPDGERGDARPRRIRSDRHPARPRARRRAGVALEGRARPAHRRSARGAGRAGDPPTSRARGGRAGLLRRQGAASARAHSGRRAADPGLRAPVRRSRRRPGPRCPSGSAPARFPVKALTAAGGQALVTVTGNGMLGVPGIAARTFHALHERQISVSLISQASSEHSICFSVPETFAADARESLEREFAGEIGRREIDGVEVSPGMATVAVVGLGMHGTPGVAAGVFSALAGGEDQRRRHRAGLAPS